MGQRSRHTEASIVDTLQKIYDNLPQQLYIQDNDRLIFRFSLIPFSYRRFPVHIIKYDRPVDALSDKILESPLSKVSLIKNLAQNIKAISLPLLNRERKFFLKTTNLIDNINTMLDTQSVHSQ